MTDKKLEKITKKLGLDTINEMNSMSREALTKVVIDAEHAMEAVQKELDDNAEYQRIKELKSDLESGKKEVNSRQRARIAYAIDLLKEMDA